MNQSLSRRTFLGATAGAGLVGAAGFLTGCSDGGGDDNGSIKIINTSATGAIAINHLMDEGGYFKSFGVNAKVTNVSAGNQVLAGVASGSADVTILSGLIGVFPAIEKGLKLKLLGGTQVVSTSALFSGNPQVKSVRDLSGKTLGVGAVGAELYDVFVALLAKYQISPKDVTFRNVGSSADSLKAALAKQIDCGYGQVGNKALAETKDVRMIATVNEELPLWINQGAVASAKAVSGKRKTLAKTLAAYAKLFQYLTTAESKSKYVAAYVAAGGSQPEGDLEWQFINQNKAYSPTLDLPMDKLNFIQQQNVRNGSQKKVLDAKEYTNTSIRTDALALLKG
ncbi:ABC transporter substrate-binding protein [Actinomadura sp. DC4]|uniref:ABC transporter substrate-binding protein n=1 Tax=Actinomadura sp. DC4 TaxID=3055069 RepID=UPI0025AF4690|nr:ABC transporter substrate-binding protein [Actinomadura sp. DC4]MDN3354109.1 ABC transporter substrate-binding protein [Actinomadura sp. DC4]